MVKINEVRKLLGPLNEALPIFCSDTLISRYLRARNWNTKKASKILKETLKWRLEHKPEKIKWEDVAQEAETGKIYRANYLDKHGRTVLVMRPGFQNTSSSKGQIKYLVYCIENAIFNLGPDQEQMVWLVDFQGWNPSSISVKVTRETAHVLQNYYPERLGLGILYNPPKIFESFWKIVKPFLEPKTYKKARFVYSDNMDSQKIMEDLFNLDKLESTFGGRSSIGFDYKEYGDRMKGDDERKMSSSLILESSTVESVIQLSEPLVLDPSSDASDEASASSDLPSPNSGVVDYSSDGKIQPQLSCKEIAKVAGADAQDMSQLTESAKDLQAIG
ncbi:uncharacterized protein LOC131251108 isoform X2 [Magnolia sinica]|uniref:uncharacterized protein LOC131251108 isoform X2 n=1 Tax=Magnolia sinica TaxID=86752 RepID=UPI00265A48CC|nr:uncharacterized protein LOC131251108 isoform X2 [Magnolia sinica]XP_058107606.1 uncharacterized protein LOC131251108 isoform X2 [Magnolia sinica]